MIPTIIATALRALLDGITGRKSDVEVARDLIDAALNSGIPAELLREHLTQRGIQAGELAADIAQAAKTGGT